MRNKPLSQYLWENNIHCQNCGKFIPKENRKKFRACENGYSYCSDRCAEEDVEATCEGIK